MTPRFLLEAAFAVRWYTDMNLMRALLYEEIEGRLVVLLSSCAVGRISHMGSTAVDGIWAKDIADVMVELSSQSDLDKAAETLERSGFTMMSDEGEWVSLFKTAHSGTNVVLLL